MLSTFLVEHRWLMPCVLLALVVLGPPLGAWLAPRPRVAWPLTGLVAAATVLVTMVPPDASLGRVTCAVQWSWPKPGAVELFANVVLFVPLVLLLGVALRRPWVAAVAGSLLSVLVEAVQALVPAIGRACDTNDWWCNSLGAVVGAGLAAAALVLARRSGTTGAADPSGSAAPGPARL